MRDPMDNFEVKVVGYTDEVLAEAISLIMGDSIAKSWSEVCNSDEDPYLIVFWIKDEKAGGQNIFLGDSKAKTITPQIQAWLKSKDTNPTEKPPEYVDYSKGFEIKTSKESYEIFRIRPIWATHSQ